MASRAPVLSSNPELAAIQAAKAASAAQATMERSGSTRDQGAYGSSGAASSPSKPAALTSCKSIPTAPGGPKNVFGAEDGKNATGWWSVTDAGAMNADEAEDKHKKAASGYTPQYDSTLGSRKLDFSSMFSAGADTSQESSSAAEPASLTQALAADLLAPAHSSGSELNISAVTDTTSVSITRPAVETKSGTVVEEVAKSGWWTQMDGGLLNQAEVDVPKGTASGFTPQFVGTAGGLHNKLDFSKMSLGDSPVETQ
mmetsp:Transcript_21379/g.36442  ORF Transcript_21379/g.36442 Transcript_21379/m.36442 type:complete len:256 (+) Transcript_21379:81-848(+)